MKSISDSFEESCHVGYEEKRPDRHHRGRRIHRRRPGALFHEKGFTRIRAVDKKPLPDWYQRVDGVESLCLDVSEEANCHRVCEGAVEVYNLAADMGGMGFIERFRVQCLRSILINTHMIEAA